MKEKTKKQIEKTYANLSDEEKDILKRHNLFYYSKLPRYKVARGLLILEDELKKFKKQQI